MIYNMNPLGVSKTGAIHGIIRPFPLFPREDIDIGDFVKLVKIQESDGSETLYARKTIASIFDGIARTSGKGTDEYDKKNILMIYTLSDKEPEPLPPPDPADTTIYGRKVL